MQEQPSEEAVPKRRKLGIDEASIEFLGRAAQSQPLPEDSLVQTPARDITSAVQALAGRLRQVNVDSLLRTQGWISRLTGADIEARLRFELEVREVAREIKALRDKSRAARRIRDDLRESRAQILAGQPRLDRIITAAQTALSAEPDADSFLAGRFERRVGNLIALQASNALTCRQIEMADRNMSLLIDRVEDVATTLVTLWQHNALAIAQSVKPVPKTSELAATFLRCHDQLLNSLFQTPVQKDAA